MNTIFIGDSITANWTLPFAEAINKGVPGDTPSQVAARFSADVLTPFPWCVHILCGTNAPYADQVPIVRDMALQARAKGIKVILAKIPPRGYDVSAFNEPLTAMAAADKFMLVDYFTPMTTCGGAQNPYLFLADQTHPNAAGYAVMQDQLSPVLNGMRSYARLIANFTGALA